MSRKSMKITRLMEFSSRTAKRAAVCVALFQVALGMVMAAPTLVSTASLDGQSVGLRFDADLDPVTAGDPVRYAIADATVQTAALLADNRTVLLTVTGLVGTNYTVTGTGIKDTLGSAGNITGSGSVLGFTVQDIGSLTSPSLAYAYANSSIAVKVDGGVLWWGADSASYISQTRTGDFDVRVRVSKAAGGDGGSNIALDARESTAPGSRHVAITLYPGVANWTAFERDTTDGSTGVLAGNWRIGWPIGAAYPNIWLRIKYHSNTFTTYGSTNGLDWIPIGDAYTPSVPYATTLIGLAVAATDGGIPPVEAEYNDFGEFALGNASIVIHAQPQDVTTTENHAVAFSVSAELLNGPAGLLTYQWQSNSVDIVGAVGSNYVFQIPKLANSGDRFRVVVSAPGVAAVTSAVATLTVQADLSAPYALSAAGLAAQNVAVRFSELLDPVTAADATRYSLGSAVAVEAATLLPDQQTVVLQASTLAGTNFSLQVTGVQDLAGNAATFTITGPVLNFVAQDIGNLVSPSLVYADAPSHLVTQVDGGAIWFGADADNYSYQTRTNDFDVRAQVLNAQGSWNANAALDVRESADPASRHVAITVYPTMGNWTAFCRDTTGGPTTVLQGNWRIDWPAGAGYPNIWLRIRRSANIFTTFGSTDGVDWMQIANDYTPGVPYGDTVLVGLAAATTDAGVAPVKAEFGSFGDFSLTGASIVINTQPQDVTAVENHPATFSVGAQLLNGPAGALVYQWQQNGLDIPGANQAIYTLMQPTLANQGAQFRVRVFAPGLGPIYSGTATLRVVADTVPPIVESSAGVKGTSVGIRFDEFMDVATVTDLSRYSLGGSVTIASATLLADGRSIVLQVPGLTGSSYTLQITGVKDAAGNAASFTITGQIQNYDVQDIGTLNSPSLVYAFTTNAVTALVDGGGIWFNADSANFISQPMSGDFDVRVQVTNVAGGDLNSNMLLDVRESADPGSRHVAITVYPSQKNWTAFFRDTTGGPSGVLAGFWRVAWPAGVDFPNVWVRLQHTGNTFAAYGGTNGLDWVSIGNPYAPTVPYTNTLVGMASAVTDAGQPPLLSEFSNFSSTIIRPQLQIVKGVGNITVLWPLESTGFHLEKAAQLGSAASWVPVTEPVGVSGLNNTSTVPVTTGTWFYRLVH
jgi:hypothetical protein